MARIGLVGTKPECVLVDHSAPRLPPYPNSHLVLGAFLDFSGVRGLLLDAVEHPLYVDLVGEVSKVGVYAAGDVTTVPFKQIVIAMGEGAKAALSAFEDRIHREAPVAAAAAE